MFDKDYYQLLQIAPSASSGDIRKAYRQLALKFHPDKNNTPDAAAQFLLINEAYAVLNDPAQRKKYDSIRFAGQVMNSIIATTPAEIREMSEELTRRIQKSNPDRINRDKLVQDLNAILSVYHIQLLENHPDSIHLSLIVTDCLFCLQYTDCKDCMVLLDRLQHIKGLNTESGFRIQSFRKQYLKSYYWNRYKMLVVLAITLVFCLLLYLSRSF
ncbi:J domain-containing protein [Sediminibacterium goheungense]|uniref:DnaJ-like protein n=1 Tax=Sediminibacterium goheungense TaxID=1086393 RepID=A0A4R6IZ82_9BACT|nr:DnaJ domain-containing protein [Sediminibacterium goheungense]TDO28194.1 DnaJ-like protein [Sediminibacterium goheungense]